MNGELENNTKEDENILTEMAAYPHSHFEVRSPQTNEKIVKQRRWITPIVYFCFLSHVSFNFSYLTQNKKT